MWTVCFKPDEMLVDIAVNVKNGHGSGELRRRSQERSSDGGYSTDEPGMSSGEQLRHRGTAGEAGEEDAMAIGMVALKNIFQNSQEITIVIDGLGAGSKDVGS